jgi:RNA polymerase sigma-B factor
MNDSDEPRERGGAEDEKVPARDEARDEARDAEPEDQDDDERQAREDARATHEKFVAYRKTRDRALRNELVEEHMRLAEFLARRFVHRGEPLDDLRQVALVGLLKAVERFEPDRGLQFSSFAMPTIVGELKRHFRDRGWAVRVPRRVQELHLELDRTIAALSQELGRPPTPREIAARAGVQEEDVLESMEASSLYRLPSIDAIRSGDDAAGAPAERIGDVDPEMGAVDNRLAVGELLSLLPEREQTIVYLRFFEGLTQSEIAEHVGISQMHVSRLLVRSLETLSAHTGAVAD